MSDINNTGIEEALESVTKLAQMQALRSNVDPLNTPFRRKIEKEAGARAVTTFSQITQGMDELIKRLEGTRVNAEAVCRTLSGSIPKDAMTGKAMPEPQGEASVFDALGHQLMVLVHLTNSIDDFLKQSQETLR